MLRVGMVGAGMISEFHLKGWTRVQGAELVAVCDPDIERAKARAAGFGIGGVYDDMERMIRAERLDAVDIATPLATHVPLVEQAARSGVAIMCQKPLAASLDAAEKLVEAVSGRARLMVHENWRFRPYYRQIAACMASGMIGDPVQVEMRAMSSGLVARADGSRPALLREPGLRLSEQLVVGTLLIHHLDVLRYLLGPMQVVAARRRREISDVVADTMATIMLETKRGAPVVLMGNMAAAGRPTYICDELVLVGSAGVADLFDGQLSIVSGTRRRQWQWPQEEAYQAAFDGAIQHFVDSVVQAKRFESDAFDNIETVRLVDTIMNSTTLSVASSCE